MIVFRWLVGNCPFPGGIVVDAIAGVCRGFPDGSEIYKRKRYEYETISESDSGVGHGVRRDAGTGPVGRAPGRGARIR